MAQLHFHFGCASKRKKHRKDREASILRPQKAARWRPDLRIRDVYDAIGFFAISNITAVHLMSAFSSKLVPDRIKLLVVRDADIASTSRLAEHFVHQEPQFTAVILCGPLARLHDDTKGIFILRNIVYVCACAPVVNRICRSSESIALAVGHMSTIVAQLENIVCRYGTVWAIPCGCSVYICTAPPDVCVCELNWDVHGCRVVYLPSAIDPAEVVFKQLHVVNNDGS